LPRPARLASHLIALEESWYGRVRPPDILIALKVDPEIAVRRRTDEDADFVRARSAELWNLDWNAGDVVIVNANQPPEQVLAEIKSAVWQRL
jgi:thymidylate kinase